jgi:beta-glucosidase
MAKTLLTFPDGFLWGVSSSAYQTEGGNDNDWTEWEQQNAERLAAEAGPAKDYGNGPVPRWKLIAKQAKDPSNYLSGKAVDSWNRWQEDVDLAKSLNLNAFRFSVEWSRIEPKRGQYDKKAIDHYVQMAKYCQKRGLRPLVTLYHFTLPVWTGSSKAWEDRNFIDPFVAYVQVVIKQMPRGIDYLIINEPEMFALLGWLQGEVPPYKKSILRFRKVMRHLSEAHNRSYDAIKQHDPKAQISSAVQNIHFDATRNFAWPINATMAKVCDRLLNHDFHHRTMDHQDFIALNHYMHCVVNLGMFKNPPTEPRSDLGWYLHPESMYAAIKAHQRYGKPIWITENGLADKKDKLRQWYLPEVLQQVHRAIADGIDVRGYFHWSLTNNFEWNRGFWAEFGLVDVDRTTLKRIPRKSARLYAEIASQNSLKLTQGQLHKRR